MIINMININVNNNNNNARAKLIRAVIMINKGKNPGEVPVYILWLIYQILQYSTNPYSESPY